MKNYKLKNPQATYDETTDPALTDDNDQGNSNQFNEIKTLQSILQIMQPGETVVRTIKRLGAAASK